MRGMSVRALHALDALLQFPRPDMPLSRPGAGQLHPLIVRIRQVEAEAHGLLHTDGLTAFIDDPHRPRNRRMLRKERVEELEPDPGDRVPEKEMQRLSLPVFLTVCRGQALKRRLAFRDRMAFVPEVRDRAPVFQADDDRRMAEIPCFQ